MKHTLFWGQSLALGSQGVPSLSTGPETANAWLVAANGSSSIPLQSSVQQQPQLSCGYRLSEARPTDRHLFSTHGLGGTSIEDLGKGGSSGRYEQAIDYATAAYGVESANGYTVEAVHAIQGEADQTFGTTFEDYLAAFTQLHTDFEADIDAVTGQGTVPLITSQTATWAYYGSPARIGLAHLEAARTVPGIHVVGGQYQFPYADDLHMTNVGYYKLGELHARVQQALVDGDGWEPFAPTGYTVTPTYIDVHYHVPTGVLEFDTTTVPAQPDMGFSLAGTAATITAVSIVAGNRVRLYTSQRVVEPAAAVGYGVAYDNGSVGLGNLCDGETALSVLDDTRLANWALHSLDALNLPDSFAYDVAAMYYVGSGGNLYAMTPVDLD
ncbi:sialate O-acetylesterase [Microbacterium sp. ZXX196]|uniref:sialate O-acetylesterase n=1 Tax=Microbacterium sp. ZXX196 TaxID=2609291 RepID=UPI0018ACCFAD